MKAKIYSVDELYRMSKTELEKVVKTQAERYNKQITRAKKAGLSLATVGGDRRLQTRNLDKKTINELASQYINAEKRFRAGATKKGLKENEKNYINQIAAYMGFDLSIPSEKERFEAFYKKYVAEQDIDTQIRVFDEVRELDESVSATSDKMWYNYARAMVESGQVESFKQIDIAGTDIDYASIGFDEYLKRMREFYEAESQKR